MQLSSAPPGLYGITARNASRLGDDLWGKNQFNSTFPLALALYMRDNEIDPVAVIAREGGIVADDQVWNMAQIVGSAEQEPYYCFEAKYEPYAKYSRNAVDKIDLVILAGKVPFAALEVKLTVVPDISTASKGEHLWAPELVMRPVSSAHAMMSVAAGLLTRDELQKTVLESLKDVYNDIDDWTNATEIKKHAKRLMDALSQALSHAEAVQKPFLFQPVWRTKGQSLELSEKCFDAFVWSDIAVMRIPVEQAKSEGEKGVGRFMREVARHVRALYDLLTTRDFNYLGIYKGMGFDTQTDKSFSLSGRKNAAYLNHPRLNSPILSNDVLGELVQNGGEYKLKPERRFDAAVLLHMKAGP